MKIALREQTQSFRHRGTLAALLNNAAAASLNASWHLMTIKDHQGLSRALEANRLRGIRQCCHKHEKGCSRSSHYVCGNLTFSLFWTKSRRSCRFMASFIWSWWYGISDTVSVHWFSIIRPIKWHQKGDQFQLGIHQSALVFGCSLQESEKLPVLRSAKLHQIIFKHTHNYRNQWKCKAAKWLLILVLSFVTVSLRLRVSVCLCQRATLEQCAQKVLNPQCSMHILQHLNCRWLSGSSSPVHDFARFLLLNSR